VTGYPSRTRTECPGRTTSYSEDLRVTAPDRLLGRSKDDDRFETRGKLGAGGMGVVFRAFDHRLDREVALKSLRHASGRDLFRFKREFRALTDISHPNLAVLHELHTAGDEWFFSMELVDGVPFTEWVRHDVAVDEATIGLGPEVTQPTLAPGPSAPAPSSPTSTSSASTARSPSWSTACSRSTSPASCTATSSRRTS
jgi:hypothetical protein